MCEQSILQLLQWSRCVRGGLYLNGCMHLSNLSLTSSMLVRCYGSNKFSPWPPIFIVWIFIATCNNKCIWTSETCYYRYWVNSNTHIKWFLNSGSASAHFILEQMITTTEEENTCQSKRKMYATWIKTKEISTGLSDYSGTTHYMKLLELLARSLLKIPVTMPIG